MRVSVRASVRVRWTLTLRTCVGGGLGEPLLRLGPPLGDVRVRDRVRFREPNPNPIQGGAP